MTEPGDTTRSTISRGPVGEGGWRPLRLGPAEDRQNPVPTGEVLACIWHLSDVHLCDSESPARLEYLDRHGDPDSPYREELGDVGTYRPQEALTVQVAVAMVETVNSILVGPTTGARIDTVLLTGDVTDNAQRNELAWYQTILEGGVVSPRSGADECSSWVGATDDETWDERYWHPDGPPPGVEPDLPTRVFGYPMIPGLVAAARRDVSSPGLALPWLTVYGNHDGLVQGTVTPDAELRALAVGDARITDLPMGVAPIQARHAIAEVGPARYVHDDSSPRTRIAPDAARDFLVPGEFAHATRPADAGDPDEPTYYVADAGLLRIICLDTVNPYGGWQGSIGEGQFAWLVDQLNESTDRYVVIASHHPSPTLTNHHRPDGAERRVLGEELLATLMARKNVVAWIAGHVHFHAALWHSEDGHGFWELTTASLVDWPQQARILEFLRVSDAGRPEIAIVSTVVDHRAPVEWRSDDLDDPINLASVSRSLAANDYRLRERSMRGLRLDSSPDVRNVVWRSPDPFAP